MAFAYQNLPDMNREKMAWDAIQKARSLAGHATEPERGYIELPATPGFGLELNRDEVNLIRPYDRS